jgi:hypothetical protein
MTLRSTAVGDLAVGEAARVRPGACSAGVLAAVWVVAGPLRAGVKTGGGGPGSPTSKVNCDRDEWPGGMTDTDKADEQAARARCSRERTVAMASMSAGRCVVKDKEAVGDKSGLVERDDENALSSVAVGMGDKSGDCDVDEEDAEASDGTRDQAGVDAVRDGAGVETVVRVSGGACGNSCNGVREDVMEVLLLSASMAVRWVGGSSGARVVTRTSSCSIACSMSVMNGDQF